MLTRQQLLERGLSARQCRLMVEAGELRRIRPGLFAIGPAPETVEDDWWQRCAIELAAAGPDAVLARQAAAVAWALDGFEPPVPIDVNVPKRSGRRGARLHRRSAIGDNSSAVGLPVTSALQTLLEVGDGLGARRFTTSAGRVGQRLAPADLVELAAEAALRRGLVTEAELHEAVMCLPRQRPGLAVLADVLARRPPGAAATASHLETRGIQVLRSGGLPDGERQAVIRHAGRFVARVDLLLAERVIVEFDGRQHHGEDRFDADRRRWTRLSALGYRLGVFTWEQVEFQPGYVIREVDALLAAS